MSTSRRADSGFQSGHDTQFIFSEGDIRNSDADPSSSQAVAGEFVIAQSFKFL